MLSPSRIQAAFLYSAEKTGLDSRVWMLRFGQNLIEGLDDGLDAEILNGTNGLFTGYQPGQQQPDDQRRPLTSLPVQPVLESD